MCVLATIVTCALAPRRPLPAVRTPAARMSSPSPSSTADTVSKLLALVEPTDRGIAASDSTRAEASSLISALEESWAGTDAFASPYLLRNTEVVYVGQSSSKGSNAAGGKYRGRIGRALFRTDALFQHVLDDVAVNVVQFRLLGLVPGSPVVEAEDAFMWFRPALEKNTHSAVPSWIPLHSLSSYPV